jgi:RHS repeat-associated protein
MIRAVLLALGLLFVTHSAIAAQLDTNRYDIYYGDVDGNGLTDVYFHGRERLVLLHGDIVTPIVLPAPDSFVLKQHYEYLDPYNLPIYAYYELQSVVPPLSESVLANYRQLEAGHDVYAGDFNGDGKEDLLVLNDDQSTTGFPVILSSTDTSSALPTLQANLSLATNPWLADMRTANVQIRDATGDGKDNVVFLLQSDTYADVAYDLSTANASTAAQRIALTPPTVQPAILVGSTDGQLRVNESGAATYAINIATPAGTAGVAPQLALSYSSQGQNGLLGQGWSLSGLSAITRCRQTLTQDNNPEPITWTSGDRYCLDGQRLLLVSGSHGAPGAVYKTEIESFTTVTAHGGSAGNPDYFVVEKKDGSRAWYGNGGNAEEIAHNGSTFAWAQSRFEDNAGNAILYLYHSDAGNGFRIQAIHYAFGSAAPSYTASNAVLTFSYEDRFDPRQGYFAGYLTGIKKRLSRINVANGGQTVRTYHLDYLKYDSSAPVPDRTSRLAHVQECAGSQCLPATRFDWSVLPQLAFQSSTGNFSLSTAGDSKDRHGAWRLADINGDGHMDIVIERYHIGSEHTYHYLEYRLSTNEGTALTDSPVNEYTWSVSLGQTKVGSDREPFKWALIDYNNDGRTDVVTWHQSVSYFNVYLSQPNGSGDWRLAQTPISVASGVDPAESHVFADINGDGLVDAVSPSGYWLLERDTAHSNTSTTPYRFGSKRTLDWSSLHNDEPDALYTGPGDLKGLGDFNGDGVTDIVGFSVTTYFTDLTTFYSVPTAHVLIRDGDSLQSYHPIRTPNGTNLNPDDLLQSIDINADNLPDLFFENNGNYYYQINTGAGFKAVQTFTPVGDNPRDFRFIDVDHDGSLDITYVSGNGNHYLATWRENAFASSHYNYFYHPLENNEAFALADISNDGRLDRLHLHASYGYLQPSTHQATANNVITDFTNGLGSTASITYEALNHSDNYRQVGESCAPGQPCNNAINAEKLRSSLMDPNDGVVTPHTIGWTAPIMELHGPLYVATQVEGAMPSAGSAAGSVAQGATSTLHYYYGEAYVQAGGRGFLGFRELTTLEPQTGITTTTTYNLAFPYTGYPLSTEVRTSAGQLLRQADNDWRLHNWQSTWPAQVAANGTKAIAPFQPYLATATETTWPTTTDLAVADKFTVGSPAQQSVTTTTQYDDYGNAIAITETLTGGNTFITQTENTYGSLEGQISAEANAWLQKMGRLGQSTVTHTRTVDGITQTATRTAQFTYYHYTGSVDCFAGSPALAGMLCEEIIEPDDSDPATPNYQLTKTHIYDDRGNVVRVEQQGGGEATRTVRTEYDPHGRYVDRTYNSLGHLVEEVAQRNNLGLPVAVNAPNGVTTTITYDLLGRKTHTSDTTGQWTQVTYTACGACSTGATHAVEKHTAGGGKSIVYFDELARPIREGTLSFDGQWVYTDAEYDSVGRVQRKSEPFYQGQTAAYWIETEYDSLGRTLRTVLPDGSQGTTHYDGLATTVTNDLGHQKTELRNLKGELAKAIDHLNTPINYHYDAQGNLRKVIPNNDESLAISITYDLLGRKTAMDDPDKGHWEYAYNAFGELTYQKNANNQVTVQSYDQLGRLTARTDYRVHNPAQPANNHIESHTRWYYDSLDDAGTPVANALGQVTAVVQSQAIGDATCAGATTQYCERYRYDARGRPHSTEIHLGANGSDGSYRTRTEYDSVGRVAAHYDVLGGLWEDQTSGVDSSGTINAYNSYGHLQQITDIASGDLLYRVEQTDARGNTTRELLANGVATLYGYSAETGRLENQSAYQGGIFAIQDITYQWDTVGNLTRRRNNSTHPFTGQRQDRKESFCYDGLNRLIKTALGTDSYDCASLTANQQDLRYDPSGNITYKHGVGTYTYGNGAGPHAVTHTSDGVDYFYDNNGNMTGDSSGRALHYTTFDEPDQISRGNHHIQFQYGPNRSRFERVDINTTTNATTTTHYLGNIERIHKTTAPDEVQWKRYLPGGAIYTVTTSRDTNNQLVEQSTDKVVLYKDHLGSADALTDITGNVIHAMSFDPWGQRRDPWTWANLSAAELVSYSETLSADLNQSATTRGFTGHEMLDEVGLIHMNGRIYDPRLARFLQADPFVQAASDTQLFNRYSYVRNNPLNATDPSGYEIVTIVSLIVSALVKAKVISAVWGAVIVVAATAAEVLANGGDVGQALVAAFTSFAMSVFSPGIPSDFGFSVVSTAQYVATMAVMGGISAALNGGRFGDGFRGAGLAALLGGAISKGTKFGQKLGKGGRAFARIIAGGTSSKASGKKFANGAMTAAFLFTMRELPNLYKEVVGYELDMRPGGKAVEKGPLGKPVKGANNIGTQDVWKFDKNGKRIVGTFEEGGPVSEAANKIPGINATAGVHDVFQISMGTSLARDIFNAPGMIAAGVFTYTACVGQPLQYLDDQQILYSSVAASHKDDEDRRQYKKFAGAF